jgi:hypothetical protein
MGFGRHQQPFSRQSDGKMRVSLGDDVRAVLGALPEQIRVLLADDDPSTYRMFPPAYTNDVMANDEWHQLMRSDLVARRLASLDLFERSVDVEMLSPEEADAWLSVINDVRLILSARLEIRREDDLDNISDEHPDAGLAALYDLLSACVDAMVDELSNGLPPPATDN